MLSYHDIRERLAELQNRSFANMNQRPKLGSKGRGVNVHNWVLSAAKALRQPSFVLLEAACRVCGVRVSVPRANGRSSSLIRSPTQPDAPSSGRLPSGSSAPGPSADPGAPSWPEG